MDAPNADQIKRLKDANQDRALHLVELQLPGDEEIVFVVMGGPNEDEYKMFTDAVINARENSKTETEKNEKVRFAAKQAVIRQVLWPDRDTVKAMLFKTPGFVTQLADKIHEHAGSSSEVRSKKL